MEIYDIVDYETFFLVRTSEGPDLLDRDFQPLKEQKEFMSLVGERGQTPSEAQFSV